MQASLLRHGAHNNAIPFTNEPNSPPPLLGELALALIVSAAACAARLALDPWIGSYQPLTLGVAAVAIAAWFGTWRAGIVTALTCQLSLSSFPCKHRSRSSSDCGSGQCTDERWADDPERQRQPGPAQLSHRTITATCRHRLRWPFEKYLARPISVAALDEALRSFS